MAVITIIILLFLKGVSLKDNTNYMDNKSLSAEEQACPQKTQNFRASKIIGHTILGLDRTFKALLSSNCHSLLINEIIASD